MDQLNHTQGDGSCCNLDYLLINLGRNEAAAKRLVSLFLDHYPILVKRLDDSVKACDLRALQQIAHDIRGNCLLFSAHECLETARRIEHGLHKQLTDKTADAGKIDCLPEVLQLRHSLERMVVELKGFLDEARG